MIFSPDSGRKLKATMELPTRQFEQMSKVPTRQFEQMSKVPTRQFEQMSKVPTRLEPESQSNPEIYDVGLYSYKPAEIAGTHGVTENLFGRRHDNYGCGDQPQVSVHCLIKDQQGYTMDRVDDIDELLPAILFVGKKEGDIIEIPHKGKTLRLKLNQSKLSERSSVTFEDQFYEALTHTFKGKRNVCEPTYFIPELSREAQAKLIDDFIKDHLQE